MSEKLRPPLVSSAEPECSMSEPIEPPPQLALSYGPSPTSKKKSSRKRSCSPVSAMAYSLAPQSSQTLQLSMEDAYAESRALVSPDSPASRIASLVSDLEKTTNAIYSERSFEWLMSLHSVSCSSKTCQGCLFLWQTKQPGLFNPLESETWQDSFPRAAFVADGYLWELKTWEPRTDDDDGGASPGDNWQTPRAQRGQYTRDSGARGAERLTLEGEVIQNWSTPTGDDANNVTRKSGDFKSLSRDLQNWPTPDASAHKARMQGDTQQSNSLESVVRPEGQKYTMQLNPDWEETLMGWPIGWTEPLNFAPQPWPGWPMGQGEAQYDYEPRRTVPKGSCANRVARVKACGNGVVPQCAESAFKMLLTTLEKRR